MSRRIFDAESSVTLRAEGGDNVTATGAETGVPFDPDNFQEVMIVFNVTHITAGGDHSFSFSVETDDEAEENDNVAQITLPNAKDGGGGFYAAILDCETAKKIHPAAAFIRTKVTVAGTSAPAINYHAWMMPLMGVSRP